MRDEIMVAVENFQAISAVDGRLRSYLPLFLLFAIESISLLHWARTDPFARSPSFLKSITQYFWEDLAAWNWSNRKLLCLKGINSIFNAIDWRESKLNV